MSPSLGPHRIWIAPKPLYRRRSRWRVLFRGHDALYAEAGRLRLRVFKPKTVIPIELGVLLAVSVALFLNSVVWRSRPGWLSVVFVLAMIACLVINSWRGRPRT